MKDSDGKWIPPFVDYEDREEAEFMLGKLKESDGEWKEVS